MGGSDTGYCQTADRSCRQQQLSLIQVDISMMLVVPAIMKGPVPVLMMFGRPAFPAPAQPSPEEMEKLNAARFAACWVNTVPKPKRFWKNIRPIVR